MKFYKKKYLLLLIPVILAVFIIVNFKPISLAVEYYNEENFYSLENYEVSMNYLTKKVESDIKNNNYKQYMEDITDYYINSDFVYIIFKMLGILEPYYKGIVTKLFEQTLFINSIELDVNNKDTQKISEMLKYYPIKDMENYPERTLTFIKNISHHVSATQLYTVILISTAILNNSICYVVVTKNGCDNQDYYFNKFMYNLFNQAFDYYFSLISVDSYKMDMLKKQHAETFKMYYSSSEDIIKNVKNACGY